MLLPEAVPKIPIARSKVFPSVGAELKEAVIDVTAAVKEPVPANWTLAASFESSASEELNSWTIACSLVMLPGLIHVETYNEEELGINLLSVSEALTNWLVPSNSR